MALIFMVSLNLIDGEAFNNVVTGIKTFIVVKFGWLFTLCSILSVAACAVIALSPFGAVRIGGANAKPLMNRWNWFANYGLHQRRNRNSVLVHRRAHFSLGQRPAIF